MIDNKPVTICRKSNGEYYISWWQPDPNLPGATIQVGSDCGIAAAIIMLTRILFQDEANDYLNRKRQESAEIGAKILKDMNDNPDKFIARDK